jgi:hypothetical protein
MRYAPDNPLARMPAVDWGAPLIKRNPRSGSAELADDSAEPDRINAAKIPWSTSPIHM